MAAFREAVAEGKGEAGVTLEDGILSVALGAAAHRSILTGEVTTVRSYTFIHEYTFILAEKKKKRIRRTLPDVVLYVVSGMPRRDFDW